MLSIYATGEYIGEVDRIIQSEDRLDELVAVRDFLQHLPEPGAFSLIVRKGAIRQVVDWYNAAPPFLLPEELPFLPEVLLGLLFARLGNYEKAHAYLAADHPALWLELDFINRLQQGIAVDPGELISEYSEFEEYRLMHNQAVVRHYAAPGETFDADKTAYFYREALLCAPNDEYRAFTVRHFATLLTDLGDLAAAEELLVPAVEYALSEPARTELKNGLAAVRLQRLEVPYDRELLDSVKTLLWEVLQAYEKAGRRVDAALVLVDAAYVANLCNSFAEALGYINRAVEIFREAELPGLLANAQFRKATLLYTWAQNGQPQFFRGAMECYQEALKVFTREAAPAAFAEIHHHLGVIYSEIPDEAQKKSIWAAVSSTSFQEALGFFNRQTYPYEYASICNSYGNALMKYPAAVHSDNHEKALYYFQEALDIRRAETYPVERAITLLNYLEACWYVGNDADAFNEERFRDMNAKAREVKTLIDDPAMLETAERHLEQLALLKRVIPS